MIPVAYYLQKMLANYDAIEGIALHDNLPILSELCIHKFGKKEIQYRCVWMCKVKRGKYKVRFERINWK
jgi:hypothetical protein